MYDTLIHVQIQEEEKALLMQEVEKKISETNSVPDRTATWKHALTFLPVSAFKKTS